MLWDGEKVGMYCSEYLPPGFYRAEAQWLSPSDVPDDGADLVEEVFEIKTEVLDLLLSFEEEFCGTAPEDLDPGRVYAAAQRLVSDLGECLDEWDRIEDCIREMRERMYG